MKLVDRLIKIAADPALTRHARKMRANLALLPMSKVLEKVPGKTLASKARYIGVAKESVHAWNKGKWRPNLEVSQKLSRITGYPVDLIRGGSLG